MKNHAQEAEAAFVLAQAKEHAAKCLQQRDGWTVETLAHNLQSNFFPDLAWWACDDIAESVLDEATGESA